MIKIVTTVKFYKGEISPFDGSALECALSVKDAEVTVISMSPPSAKEQLEYLTRLGVKAELITDKLYAGSDTLVTATILSRAIERIKPDIVLCGRQSVDGDTAQVPAEIAQMLGYEFIPYAMNFGLDEIETRLGKRKVKTPCVVSVEKFATLRTPSFRSRKREVGILTNAVLGFNENEVGQKGSPTKVVESFVSTEGRRKCEFVSADELGEVIGKALGKPDVITNEKLYAQKLDKIAVVGDGLDILSRNIAEKTIRIYSDDVEEIVDRIKKENVKRVFFSCTLQSRVLAPKVAAELRAGLCADCVKIETDGENVFMYRPAAGGDIIAKIISSSDVVMATVREKTDRRHGVVFGVGAGAKDYLPKIAALAEKFGAEIVATRKAVDCGYAPYSAQVGLTGRIINPKVYVAFGISGAVQHIVGIENSSTVIAVNSDKQAKIFDYADYGITEDIKNVS